MLGLGISLAEAATRGRNSFADHALALDFRNGRYRAGASYGTSAAALPGYGYARSGPKWELQP